jgi:hypothetical protein
VLKVWKSVKWYAVNLLLYLFEGITIEHGWKYQEKTKRNLSARTGYGISPEYIMKTVETMLFLLYINDLPKMIPYVQMVLYADDINTLIIDKDENKLADKTTLLMNCLES